MRRCAQCGASMEARRPQAKFCSDTCRGRNRRKVPAAVVVDLPPRQESPPPPGLLELEDQAAILAAQMLSPLTPANAMAGLSREYRAIREEIEAKRAPEADAVDELFERRSRRA